MSSCLSQHHFEAVTSFALCGDWHKLPDWESKLNLSESQKVKLGGPLKPCSLRDWNNLAKKHNMLLEL